MYSQSYKTDAMELDIDYRSNHFASINEDFPNLADDQFPNHM